MSHFLALSGSGTTPAIAELRAYYGDPLRGIVGAHDAREIVDVQLVQSALVAPVAKLFYDSGNWKYDEESHMVYDEDLSTSEVFRYHQQGDTTRHITYTVATKTWATPSSSHPYSIDTSAAPSIKMSSSGHSSWANLGTFTDPYVNAGADAGTLFDGVLDLHPTSPLRFETVSGGADAILLYAQVPKNVIPTSASVWAEGLVDPALYLADDLPGNVGSIASAGGAEPTQPSSITITTGWSHVTYDAVSSKNTATKHRFEIAASGFSSEYGIWYDWTTGIWEDGGNQNPHKGFPTSGPVINGYDTDGTSLVFSFRNPYDTWSNKLFDAHLYLGRAIPVGANPLSVATGQYAELGASARYVNGTVAPDVVLSEDKTPEALGENGKHVVTYVDATGTFSEATREVLTGPVGPSVSGSAPSVAQDVADTSAKTVDASTFFDAGGATLSYAVDTTNHALLDALTVDPHDGSRHPDQEGGSHRFGDRLSRRP